MTPSQAATQAKPMGDVPEWAFDAQQADAIGDLIESAGERFANGHAAEAARLLHDAANSIAPPADSDENVSLIASNAALMVALEQIANLRPFGDVNTCKAPRKLVEQMERIALTALAKEQGK